MNMFLLPEAKAYTFQPSDTIACTSHFDIFKGNSKTDLDTLRSDKGHDLWPCLLASIYIPITQWHRTVPQGLHVHMRKVT